MNSPAALPGPAVYHGVTRSGTCTILIEQAGHPGEGTELTHIVKHSPTGLGWGYAGSGPADTARSLLIDALGDAAVCRLCNGTQRVVFWPEPMSDGGEEYERPWVPENDGPLEDMHPSRWGTCRCDDGYGPLPYQAFKFEVVARFAQPPAEWTLLRSWVQDWYTRHQAGVAS
jgi:hypothetical protein